ncbi:MAG TPA: gephyrin-like molybdotransferase Glp [Dehalococcoidia bacterium]|nr:gephyrin-like molybdotransferase Glp [Dehalococcoidia bacterium]
MISVEEALERILSFVHELEPEDQPLLAALGQVLAEDAVAPFSIPPLDNTAMDGYAVIAASTEGASEARPVSLRVVGELAAGYVYDGEVVPGTAVRIMTGAPMPRGADSIVPFEETDETGFVPPSKTGALDTTVRVFKGARPGNNVRYSGEDVREGEVVLPRGTYLRPADIGVLASLGRTGVRVIRRPVVAILSTGDEILEPGQPRRPGTIYDSNAYSLASLVTRAGGVPLRLGIARDTIEDLTAKVHEGLRADLLITSAGVSRGDFDVVKDVLQREGSIDFHLVNMRPGKPLAFGTFRQGERVVPHIGLPGNPVSSMLVFELFGRPALYKMLGRVQTQRLTVQAVSKDRLRMTDGRRFYARCIVSRENGGWIARLAGSQSSGVLTSLARANGLAIVPEGSPDVQPGETVTVMLLDGELG